MGNTPSTFETCLSSYLPPNAISVPSDPFYQWHAVKAYNTAYDITPVAVVRPSTTEEVSNVVKCAANSGIKVQARSGGHSYGDYSIGGEDGALVIDMVNFQQFSFDEITGHATVGSGTLLGDLTERMHNTGGRAMAHGTCPQVGIGGHATIGGLGPPSRMWGAALDHVIEAEIVLANGTIVRTNRDDNPEVLFAIKGAGASFGVITEFKVITHPEPKEVVKYSYTFSIGSHRKMARMFATWQDIISQPDLPRKFASQVTVFEGVMAIKGVYYGPQSEFDALGFDQRLREHATSVSIGVDNWLGTLASLAEADAIQLGGGISTSFYSKSLAIRPDTLLSANTIESLFELFNSASKGSPFWFVIFDLAGGAIDDVPQDATAYAHRNALYFLQSYIIGFPKILDVSRNYLNNINDLIEQSLPSIQPSLGAYAGYVDPFLANGQERYWGSNYQRLREIKRELDPTDMFHNPQSVVPA